LRASQRAANSKVKFLDHPLEILHPTLQFGAVHVEVPKNGKQIRKLNCRTLKIFAELLLTWTALDMDELLRLYAIPATPTMFNYEKKRVYLQFVGANEELIHKVLD
jgi:hypothetical protein